MESNASVPGSRQLKLKKSFNRGLRCLLTACSGELFRVLLHLSRNASTSSLSRLSLLCIKILRLWHNGVVAYHLKLPDTTRLHLEQFESIFLETQAGTLLDTVEELVEEQTLDPLHSKKSNVGEVAQNLSDAKKNEVNHLMGLLEKAEEQNRKMKAHVEELKKEKQDFSGATNLVNELRTRIMNYETGDRT